MSPSSVATVVPAQTNRLKSVPLTGVGTPSGTSRADHSGRRRPTAGSSVVEEARLACSNGIVVVDGGACGVELAVNSHAPTSDAEVTSEG